MSLESEFDSQWEKFLDIVGTLIHREIENNRRLDSEIVNSIIRSEVDKWSINTHYNGAWLGNLTRKYPSLGEEFRTALKEMRLRNNISFNLDVPISRYAKLVAIAWATCLILFPVWSAYPFLIKSYSQTPQQTKPSSQPAQQAKPTPEASQQTKPSPQPAQQAKPTPKASQQTKPSPQPAQQAKPTPEASQQTKPSPQPAQQAKPTPKASQQTKPSPQPAQQAKPTPEASQQAKPTPEASQQAKPTPEASQQAKPTPKASQQTKASAWEMVGLPFVRLLLGTAFVALITFPIFSHLRTQQKKKAVDNLVEQIHKDLETTAQKLRHIVSKADKANYRTE
jgi:hypothetical protein